MSHKSYAEWWIVAKDQLKDLYIKEQIFRETAKLAKKRNLANSLVGGLYAKYSLAVNELTTCLDQSCLIQKRFAMRKLVDVAVARLMELKEELVKINLAEIQYIDGNLLQLKLTPQNVEILDSAYMFDRDTDIEDMWTKIKRGETIFHRPVEDDEFEEEEEEVTIVKQEESQRPYFKKRVITEEEILEQKRKNAITSAVMLIQINERARQERIYYGDLNDKRKLRAQAIADLLLPAPPAEVQKKAAILIQKVWKGHFARKHAQQRERDRRLLIGMTQPCTRSRNEEEKCQQTVEYRRAIRAQRLRDYVEASLDEKARILRIIGPRLMEDIGDELRQWFHEWYDLTGTFDNYPLEEVGGSILIVRGETETPEHYFAEAERLRIEAETRRPKKVKNDNDKQEQSKRQEAEKKIKEKEQRKKEAATAKKKEEHGLFDFKFPDTSTTDRFNLAFNEYGVWNERPDSQNPHQKYHMDMITVEKCYEVQLEIRRQVDELMRLELDMLKEALEIDKARTNGKKGPNEIAAKKRTKPKKVKKNKDTTAHRTTEDLFQELVDKGIIHVYPHVKLSDFKGDFSYCNWEKREQECDPVSTLGDIRMAVMMNCILPLGAETMKRPKSVLIVGHRQSGKKLLANAIFNETRCVLFDLSPPILAGKYRGKKGLKKLLHLINKMSRILQPSIIYIDGGEKPFYKKVPHEEAALEPRKLGKVLLKNIIRPIKADDKVLVLAISDKPFEASGGIVKAFERIILIPRTDYGSVFLYWKDLLMRYPGVDRNFNVSQLALISKTYPLPTLRDVVETVMVPERIIQLSYKPLDVHELLEVMLDAPEPVIDKEWQKFENWFNKTPLKKRRLIVIAALAIIRETEAKAAAKAKQK